MRHDISVPKKAVGRIIGTGGTVLRKIIEATCCDVFMMDKEGPPPGWDPDQRLVILFGTVERIEIALNYIGAVASGRDIFPHPGRHAKERVHHQPKGHANSGEVHGSEAGAHSMTSHQALEYYAQPHGEMAAYEYYVQPHSEMAAYGYCSPQSHENHEYALYHPAPIPYQPAPMYQPTTVYHPAPIYQPAPIYHPATVYHPAPVYQPAPVMQPVLHWPARYSPEQLPTRASGEWQQ